MSFQTFYLDNGIPVFLNSMPGSYKVCIDLLICAGSQNDPKGLEGLSHFLEHMMFRGTPNRSSRQISTDTLKIGGYLNAYTERDCTTFTLDVPFRQARQAVDILMDMFINPIFPNQDIEKERSVILEEIDMYNDIPAEFLMDKFMETLYPDHPLGHPILGFPETVRKISRGDLLDFYERRYRHSSLTVAVSGRVEAVEIIPLLNETLGRIPLSQEEPPVWKESALNKKQKVRFGRSVDQGQLILGVHAPGLEDPDRLPLQVMNAILGGTEVSRLYQVIREDKGLAYAVDSSHEAWLGAGIYTVSTGLDGKKIPEVEKIILEEWERMKSELAQEEELVIARNFLEGSKIMELEGAGAYNSYMGSMAVRGLQPDPEGELKQLQQVSAEDVRRVAQRLLDTDNYTSAVILPKKKTFIR